MALSKKYDPAKLYEELAKLLGGTRNEPLNAAGAGEFYDIPNYGTVRTAFDAGINPKGWDTSAVWHSDASGTLQPRYAEGDIPAWMRDQINFILYGGQKGALDAEDMAAAARHWIYGEGVQPEWRAAYESRPPWVEQWLREQLGSYLDHQAPQ